MKRILIALLAQSFAATLCLAQPVMPENKATMPVVTQVKKSPVEFKLVKGKVESVTMADPAKGVRSSLTVIADNGVTQTLIVKPTTAIYDTDWKASTLDKISKGASVKVKYSVSGDGAIEAFSISLIK